MMQIKATVLKHSLFSTIVITEDCAFERIPKAASLPIGTETLIDINEAKDEKTKNMVSLKFKVMAGVLASLILLLIFIPGLGGLLPGGGNVFAIIDVDINPCISFAINKDAKVISATSLNDDGDVLLEDLDFKDLEIGDAIALFMEKAKLNEYDSSFVLISGAINSDKIKISDDDKLETLLQSILQNEKMKDFEVLSQAVKVSPKIREAAKKNGISLARQAAFFYANKISDSVSLDEIKDYETSDIFLILTTDRGDNEEEIPTEIIVTEKDEEKLPAEETKPEEVAKPVEEAKPEEPKEEPKEEKPVEKPQEKPKEKPQEKPDNVVRKATVTIKETSKGIELNWNKVDERNFSYYKVVLSKYNSSPAYPEDGYAEVISNVNTTGYLIKPGTSYNGGDLDGTVESGETYYVSITAVYSNEKVKGNAVKIKIPGSKKPQEKPEEKPVDVMRKATVAAKTTDRGIRLSWNEVDDRGFSYYKIVLSKYNSSPAYPEDGYLVYISDASDTSYTIKPWDSYNGGDFGGTVEPDETYYISITAVYNNEKVKGNAVKMKMPED